MESPPVSQESRPVGTSTRAEKRRLRRRRRFSEAAGIALLIVLVVGALVIYLKPYLSISEERWGSLEAFKAKASLVKVGWTEDALVEHLGYPTRIPMRTKRTESGYDYDPAAPTSLSFVFTMERGKVTAIRTETRKWTLWD